MKDNSITNFYIIGIENQNKALDNNVPQKEKEPLLMVIPYNMLYFIYLY